MFVSRHHTRALHLSTPVLLGDFPLPRGGIMPDDTVEWSLAFPAWRSPFFGWLRSSRRRLLFKRQSLRDLILIRISNRRQVSRVSFDPHSTFQAPVRNLEHQVVEIVASSGIIPSDQVLIQIINVAADVREWVAHKLELRHISKDFWIGAKINILRVSFRLDTRRVSFHQW